MRRASLGGSETACWTETKPWKSLAESFAGREQDSMPDGQETEEIACGELRWEGETACWTDRKPCR